MQDIKWIDSIYIFKFLYPKLENYKLNTIIDNISKVILENRHNTITATKNLFYVFKDKKIVFTGSLQVSRIAIIEKINNLGGLASNNLRKDTAIIIVGDKLDSKFKKVHERGLTIIYYWRRIWCYSD